MVGARKSPSSTGLKLIQKLASNGNKTIDSTISNVGSIMEYASRISPVLSGPRPFGGVLSIIDIFADKKTAEIYISADLS